MLYKFVIIDRCEGKLTFNITGGTYYQVYDELCVAAAENNCQDWEIEEEYEYEYEN